MIHTENNSKIEESVPNRGDDTKAEDSLDISIKLEDIDGAIIDHITQNIQPHVTQDDVKISVPVWYANPERWKSVRKDGVFKDNKGKLQLPLILVRRSSMAKNDMNKPINKYLDIDFVASGWNKRNIYDKFALQNGIIPSQIYTSVIYPDYYDITYQCILWTEKVSQMNSLVEQISFEMENYWGVTGRFKFKTSVEEYTNDVDLPDVKDRLVRTNFDIIVKGYLLPEDYINKHGKSEVTGRVRYTTKKLVITETIISN